MIDDAKRLAIVAFLAASCSGTGGEGPAVVRLVDRIGDADISGTASDSPEPPRTEWTFSEEGEPRLHRRTRDLGPARRGRPSRGPRLHRGAGSPRGAERRPRRDRRAARDRRAGARLGREQPLGPLQRVRRGRHRASRRACGRLPLAPVVADRGRRRDADLSSQRRASGLGRDHRGRHPPRADPADRRRGGRLRGRVRPARVSPGAPRVGSCGRRLAGPVQRLSRDARHPRARSRAVRAPGSGAAAPGSRGRDAGGVTRHLPRHRRRRHPRRAYRDDPEPMGGS